MKVVVAAALILTVISGGLIIAAIHVIAGETWPEF